MSYVFGLVALFFIGRLIYSLVNRERQPSSQAQRALAPTTADDDAALIAQDLGRLDRIEPGLGKETTRYVVKGDNNSVLLRLDKHKTAVADILSQRSWSSEGNWVSGRSDFLLNASQWRPNALRRYGTVLDLIRQNNSWLRPPGSDASPGWFRALLQDYGPAHTFVHSEHAIWKVKPSARAKQPWSITQLRELLGEDQAPILDAAFTRDDNYYSRLHGDAASPESMPGFDEHLKADPERRIRELKSLGAKARANGLRKLARLGLVDGPWLAFAFDQAADSAKSAREAAALLLRAAPGEALLRRTRETWSGLKAGQKSELAAVVMAAGPDGAALIRDLAEGETSESVRADLKRRLGEDVLVAEAHDGQADGPDGYTGLDGGWVAAPPAAPLPEDVPVSPALRDLIRQAFEVWREEAKRHNDEAKGQKYFYPRPVPGAEIAAQFVEVLDGRRNAARNPEFGNGVFVDWGMSKPRAALRDQILNHPDLTLWHLARTQSESDRSGWHYGDRSHAVFQDGPLGRAMKARLAGGRDLRTYMDIAVALGSPPQGAMRHLIGGGYGRPDLEDWSSEALWPYLLRHLGLFDQALGLAPTDGKGEVSETSALEILARFPQTPARYIRALLDRAVGDRKLVRPPARRLLRETPGLAGVLTPLLKHPKSDMRAGAAQWLGELKSEAAVEPLATAARKELIPAAKAAMLAAISHLGGEIGEFVSAKALLGEAEAGLKKASLKGLEWFPFDGLPVVRQQSGTALDPAVVRWWVVLAVKLKQPGGNPWFDLLLDQLVPEDAAKLGLAVMQAFVAYDTRAPSEAEANAYAAANVDAQLTQWKRWDPSVTREKVFSMLRGQKLSAYFGSANDQKGMLALSVRAPGADAVNIARSYFRDHYTRTAQCKAIIECLAGNPSPLAIQFVLSIAKRWRTRGVQELAGQLVETIAERRGWTPEELADRTIPTGGFDEAGVLELPVGVRAYQARLEGEGRLTLFNPDGKAVQGLPASAAGEAAASLKDSKALLTTARKELKQVWDFQSRRLYEALCVERDWPTEEWSEHILRHPIVGRMAQRLVWMGLDDQGRKAALFRPLEDLTLTDAADGSVDPTAFPRVRLAHSTAMAQEEAAAWTTHLADYEVAPLFDQLSRPTLAPADGRDTEIVDRKGWMIEAFKLRGAAAKLGYNRGAAEDGGVFMTYEKPFEALKMVAVIEFTGNGLPEENRPSALVALRFVRPGKSGGWLNWSHGLPLKDVPKVLLSEAWNDLHVMAAAGTGFDAEWEKKAGW